MDNGLAMRQLDTWAAQRNQSILIDYRDFNLQPGQMREEDATDQLWILEWADEGIHIESELGHFDLRSTKQNENQHRHQGLIRITNQTNTVLNVVFLVGIGS